MNKRVQQVSKLLKKEISDLMKENVPEELGMITVMEVFITDDLKEAKVYVSCFESDKEKQILSFLDRKTFDWQHQLGRRLKLRYTPKISFQIDQSVEKINRIDELLAKVQKEDK